MSAGALDAGVPRHLGAVGRPVRLLPHLHPTAGGGTGQMSLGTRHRMPFNSINEGSKCVFMMWRAAGLADIARHVIVNCHVIQRVLNPRFLSYMTWRATSGQPYPGPRRHPAARQGLTIVPLIVFGST